MDLKRILEVRVGHSVIPESVLETIAKKVESSSGDARKALDVAARAVTDCLHQTPDDAMTYGTLVKNLDVMKVFQSFEKNYKEIMEGQPTAGKVVMCIASVFAERNRSVTFDELYELANDVLNATGRLDDMLQSEDFNIMVSILVDSGLLRTSAAPKKRGKKKSNEMNAKASSLVELDMPVGDVCALLGAEMNIPFYKIIRERAERRVK
jgi:Cdc6-like AAA superfamily ATPase